MHGASRRRGGQELHRPGRAGRRSRGQDHRGPDRWREAPSAPAGLVERPWPAVRLRHAGHDHGGGRPPPAQSRSDRGRGAQGARGQSLPLHRLPQHRQGGPRRGEGREERRERATGGVGMSATEAPPSPGNGHVGQALRRKEDPRLIQGQASYVDDITLTGQVWAAWVRSPEAHAKIVSIDTSAAKARDGVLAVYTHEDLDMEAGLPMAWVPPGVEVNTPDHWVLAKGEVKHVGDPVALVIGNDRYTVVDAAEDVIVDYVQEPVVTDPEKALEEGSALVHEK